MRGDRARRRVVRQQQGPQVGPQAAGRRQPARSGRQAAGRRLQAVRGRVDRDPLLHQGRRDDRRLVLRRRRRRLLARRQASDPVNENDLPDVREEWSQVDQGAARTRRQFEDRTAKTFFVPKDEIADNGYDLSLNRYKEIVYEEVEYDPPKVIIGRLRELEEEIADGPQRTGGDARMTTATTE